jgi:hypothetical protein
LAQAGDTGLVLEAIGMACKLFGTLVIEQYLKERRQGIETTGRKLFQWS